jgi:hypothetical protein
MMRVEEARVMVARECAAAITREHRLFQCAGDRPLFSSQVEGLASTVIHHRRDRAIATQALHGDRRQIAFTAVS